MRGPRPRQHRPTRRASDGRSLWLEPTSPHCTSPADPGRGGTDPDLGHRRPARRPGAVGHRRSGRARRPPGRRRSGGRRRTIGWWWWSGRPGRARPPCCAPPSTICAAMAASCSVSPRPRRPPTSWRRDRDGDRHRRQAPPRMAPAATGSPTTATGSPSATTVVVDEASMLGTSSLHQLIRLAEHLDWRLVLVGDPRQLQAVGRGGMFAELCATSRTHELVRIHRFTQPWEAAASLQLRAGEPDALDALRGATAASSAGPLDEHLAGIAADWLDAHRRRADRGGHGQQQPARRRTQQHHPTRPPRRRPARLRPPPSPIAGGERAHVGEIVVTRRNDRRLTTSTGETVRNRDLWTVTATHPDGALTVDRARWRRDRDPAGRVRRRACPARLRRHRARAPGRHRRRRHRPHLRRHHPSRAVRRRHPRPRREPHPRHHRARGPRRGPRRPRRRPGPRPGRQSPPSPNAATSPTSKDPQHDRSRKPSCRTGLRPGGSRFTIGAQFLVDGVHDREQRRPTPSKRSRRCSRPSTPRERHGSPTPDRSATSSASWTTELRPAMWSANHDAREAGFGHRRHAERIAADARAAVEQAQAAIAAIHADGAPVKQHLDQLQRHAAELRGRAEPIRRARHASTATRSANSTRSSTPPTPTRAGSKDDRRPRPGWPMPSTSSPPSPAALPRLRGTPARSSRPSGTSSSTSLPATSSNKSGRLPSFNSDDDGQHATGESQRAHARAHRRDRRGPKSRMRESPR